MLLKEEYQEKNKLSAKHQVEEAMTDAFVRKCNNCKKSFLKEDGCNKMTCSCGNQQCYVCSENIASYSHFGDEPGSCPMYGDMRDLLQEEVAKAEETAVKQLLDARIDLKDEDVRVNSNKETNHNRRQSRVDIERWMEGVTVGDPFRIVGPPMRRDYVEPEAFYVEPPAPMPPRRTALPVAYWWTEAEPRAEHLDPHRLPWAPFVTERIYP